MGGGESAAATQRDRWRLVPMVGWLRSYDRGWLRGDLVAGVTLVSGVLYLLLAVFKMGWIAQFLSRAVVTGFLFGAAIDVVIGELPKLTGTETTGSNSFQELWSWLRTLGD